MPNLVDLVESLGLPPLVQLLLLPFALIGAVVSGVKGWDKIREIWRQRLTHHAKYDLLKKVQTGLERRYLEGLLGQPQMTYSVLEGTHDVVLYAEPEYILKLVYTENDQVGMYSVMSRDLSFKPPFRVAGQEYRLGEVTYAELSEGPILYAAVSGKDVRYAEGTYLANPGDYQDLLLATHLPPGVRWNGDDSGPGIVDLCHELHLTYGEPRAVWMRDNLVQAVRSRAKPNCYGFASMGFDYAGRIAVGAVYAHIRPLLREG